MLDGGNGMHYRKKNGDEVDEMTGNDGKNGMCVDE